MKSLEFKKKVQARRCFLEVVSIDPVTGIKTLGVKRKGWVKASSQYLLSRVFFVIFLLMGILRASLYICYKIITQSPDAQPISRRRGSKVVYISRCTELLKRRSEFNNKMCRLDHNPSESSHLIVYLDTVSKGLILSNLSITILKKRKRYHNTSYSSLLTKRRRLNCDTTYNLLSAASELSSLPKKRKLHNDSYSKLSRVVELQKDISLSIVPKKRKFHHDSHTNLSRVVELIKVNVFSISLKKRKFHHDTNSNLSRVDKFFFDHKRRKFDCATNRNFSPISNNVLIERKKRTIQYCNLFSRPSDFSMDTKRKKLNFNSTTDSVGTSNAVTTIIKKRKLEYDTYNNQLSPNDIPLRIIRMKFNIRCISNSFTVSTPL